MKLATTIILTGALGGATLVPLAASPFVNCPSDTLSAASRRQLAECLYEATKDLVTSGAASAELHRLASGHRDEPWALLYLGHLRWTEPDQAEGLYRSAAEGFSRREDAEGEILARSNLSQVLFKLGRLPESSSEAEQAHAVAVSSGIPELRVRGTIILARHLLQVGKDLDRARALLLQVRGGPWLSGSEHLRETYLATLGNVALAVGDGTAAEGAFLELVALAVKEGDAWVEATARYSLARVAVDRSGEDATEADLAEILSLARRARRVGEIAGHASVESKAHWILGVLGTGQQAEDHLLRCVELAPTSRDQGYCLNAMARQQARTDPARAGRFVDQALSLAEEAADAWSHAFALRERMRVSWAAERLSQAIGDSWEALDAIETLRSLQEDGSDVQAGLFSAWADDYHWFAGRLLEEARATGRGDLLAEAFAVSERLRARALTDWLRAAGKDGAVEGAARSATARGAGFASLAEIQRALGPREALLAFQVAPWEDLAGDFGGGSWVIAVTRGSVSAHPLPGRRELRQAVDLYTGLFEQRDGSEAAPSAHLYRQILAPALDELPAGIDRLVLVPDDALHHLPFGALRRGTEAPPLASTHRLSVAPSASLWFGWRRRQAEAVVAQGGAGQGGAALVLAAPVAPTAAAGSVPEGRAAHPGTALPPLVHARREGRAVVAALGRGSELARGAAASEALLARTDLARFGILHLAAHAVTDEAHPERSAVVLAPGGRGRVGEAAEGAETGGARGGSGQNGLLQTAEIAALELGGKLVVLSSCRSASGTVLRGEGVMSLGRAFFQAGARTVVASLWPVRDDEAAALFEAFYRHLAEGETVAAALQAAQADQIAAGAPASAWAAFAVLGDGDLAPVTPATAQDPEVRLALLAAGAVVASLLLALAAVALRRRLAAALAARRSYGHRLSDLASSR
jgi:CHAT domain-containing protein/tetratricopeptide (TPR) repeat protein